MKIDRLIGILAILLQQDKVTAPFLANKFEVSRRTINRDIENLSKAGIPIITMQGQNGGISIMQGYRVDRALLTSSDMQAILTGLKSLNSVCETKKYEQLMEKLSVGNSSTLTSNQHILIDLSSWYKESLTPKIKLIQDAIWKRVKIAFQYYAPKGESYRMIEPYFLIFQWASWYVWGYCCDKKAYRMFKLNRMLDLQDTAEAYCVRDIIPPDLSSKKLYPHKLMVQGIFEASMKWRLIDEYGIDSFSEQADGKLLFSFGFTDKESLFGWLLSYGSQVELTKPKELRDEFMVLLKKMHDKYKE